MNSFFIFLVITFSYLLPSIIALSLDHDQKVSLCIVNVLLGWTFIAWVVCLAWAMKNKKDD